MSFWQQKIQTEALPTDSSSHRFGADRHDDDDDAAAPSATNTPASAMAAPPPTAADGYRHRPGDVAISPPVNTANVNVAAVTMAPIIPHVWQPPSTNAVETNEYDDNDDTESSDEDDDVDDLFTNFGDAAAPVPALPSHHHHTNVPDRSSIVVETVTGGATDDSSHRDDIHESPGRDDESSQSKETDELVSAVEDRSSYQLPLQMATPDKPWQGETADDDNGENVPDDAGPAEASHGDQMATPDEPSQSETADDDDDGENVPRDAGDAEASHDDFHEHVNGTALPVGWQAVHDPATDSTYYYNLISGSTQWEVPTQEAEDDDGDNDEHEATTMESSFHHVHVEEELEIHKPSEDHQGSEQNKSYSSALVRIPEPKQSTGFAFYVDDQRVPIELERLTVQALRRQHVLQHGLHQMELRMAALTAQLAQLRMDRQRDMVHALDRIVYRPVDELLNRLHHQNDIRRIEQQEERDVANGDDVTTANWQALHRRLEALDNAWTNLVHVKIADARRDKLLAVHHDLMHTLTSELRQSERVDDKREGGMVRKMESLAGLLARRHQEERSARLTALEVASHQLKSVTADLSSRHDQQVLLGTIESLRAQVQGERAERKAHDQKVMETIASTTAAMKRAILAAYGDDDDMDAVAIV